MSGSSLRERVLEQVKRTPGKTCSELAALLGVERRDYGYSTLSSVLKKASDAGEIMRKKQPGRVYQAFAWRYYPLK